MTAIRVAIVDDHPVVAEGTAALLRAQPDLEVVALADSLDAARAAGLDRAATADVVLLDIRLGDDSGLRFLTGATDRPAVLEAVTDREVPPIPPHVTFEQARNLMLSIGRGDRGWRQMLEQSLKARVAEVLPDRR